MRTWQDCTWDAPREGAVTIEEDWLWRWSESNQGGVNRRFEREASITVLRTRAPAEDSLQGVNWRGYHWRVASLYLTAEPKRDGSLILLSTLSLMCVYGDKP